MVEAPVPDRPNIHNNASPWLKVPGSRRSAHPNNAVHAGGFSVAIDRVVCAAMKPPSLLVTTS
jgi:hypothetical protein